LPLGPAVDAGPPPGPAVAEPGPLVRRGHRLPERHPLLHPLGAAPPRAGVLRHPPCPRRPVRLVLPTVAGLARPRAGGPGEPVDVPPARVRRGLAVHAARREGTAEVDGP